MASYTTSTAIRRTVIDMFRNAGAREEIVASFVGHKVKTMACTPARRRWRYKPRRWRY